MKVLGSKTIASNGRTNFKKKRTKKNHLNVSKLNLEENASKMNLNNLPLEILEKIISNIHIWHRNRIRLVSKTFKYATDTLLMHELRSKIANFQKNVSPSPLGELITMKAIHQGTWAFVKKGFGTIFLGKMLVLLRCHYDNPFAPTLENCKKFLKQFYELVVEKFETSLSLEVRILYVLILLGYFKNIARSEKMFSEYENSGHWQIIYILNGSWFDIYKFKSSTITFTLDYIKDGFDILTVLFCLMIASHKGESFKNVYEGNDKAYFIGYDSRPETNVKTFVIVNIFSSKNMFDFLLSTSNLEKWDKFPNEEFLVEVQFFCRQNSRKNSVAYQLKIEPYFEKKIDDSNSSLD